MNAITEFTTQLVKAADDVEKLSPDERTHLLRRAFRIVRELHLQTDVHMMRKNDKLRNLEIAALRAEHGTLVDAKTVLLEIAETIRTLKIAVDENVGVFRGV